ncbi:MAG: cytochrome d ubiquinol oxidase subunit II [Halobacteria archaeon]
MMSFLSGGNLFGLPLPEIWFGVVFVCLALYIALDGFDFGVGLLYGVADDSERERLLGSMAPFWDGNEVWIIVFGGLLFAVFPDLYGNLLSRYYLVVFAVLVSLILRGVSPEFIEHHEGRESFWGGTFVLGSVAAPFFLGVLLGNWISLSSSNLSIVGIVAGVAVVAYCLMQGVAYYSYRTDETEFHLYGYVGAGVYLVSVLVAVAYLELTNLANIISGASIAVLLLDVALLIVALTALRRGRRRLSFYASTFTGFFLVVWIGVVLFPNLDPVAGLSITEGAVSGVALNLVSIMAVFLFPLIAFYFILLYSVMGGEVEEGY